MIRVQVQRPKISAGLEPIDVRTPSGRRLPY